MDVEEKKMIFCFSEDRQKNCILQEIDGIFCFSYLFLIRFLHFSSFFLWRGHHLDVLLSLLFLVCFLSQEVLWDGKQKNFCSCFLDKKKEGRENISTRETHSILIFQHLPSLLLLSSSLLEEIEFSTVLLLSLSSFSSFFYFIWKPGKKEK